MKYLVHIAAAGSCLSLIACSGGGAGSGGANLNLSGPTAAVAQGYNDTFNAYQGRIKAGTLNTFTPTGTATMNGAFGFTEGGNNPIVGDLALQADFAKGTITGKAANFGKYDNSNPTAWTKVGAVTGSLAINGNATGSNMSATAAGQLSDGTTTVNGQMNMTGSLYNDAGKTLALGNVTGTITPTGAGSSPANVTGSFYATQ